MRRALRITAAGGAATVAVSAVLAGAALPASASASRTALPGSQPGWANAKALRGDAPDTDVVHARVYLPYRDRADLDATAAAVSTPGNASYGKFLTPAQFRQKYAPSQSDVAAVSKWLRDAGLTVVTTPDNGRFVAVEGTVAQAEAAFGTQLGLYSAYGRVLRAPETTPTVPAALGGAVESVVGLDDTPALLVPDHTGTDAKQNHGAPGAGFRVGTPCSTYFGEKTVTVNGTPPQSVAPCGYTPAQVRGLYGLTADDTGAGQTVAFVGANASPTLVQDVTRYSQLHNLPAPQITQIVPPGVYRHPDTPQQVPGDYYGEETLDAESIHTTAPQAKLLFVGSSNAYQDFDASINHIVDKHLAPIISISYGFTGEGVPQGFVNSLNGTFAQAVATGIGVFVSSGDDGDDAIDFAGRTAVDFYANSPNVTAVGGTSAAVVPSGAAPAPTAVTGADPRSASALYGLDDPQNAVNQPGWKRSFEVGWQTSLASAKGTLTPSVPTATAYTFTGDVGAFGFQSGAGGGVSKVFPQPSYQKGVTDGAKDGSTGFAGGRAVPDISALADPNTGFLVGQTQQFSDGTYYDEYRLGGTSLAAPLMAGMAAVANQKAGHALGFLNPLIYTAKVRSTVYDVDRADHPEYPATVFRVNWADSESPAGGVTYSLRTLESPSQSLHSTQGYDTATGVGTPTGDAFLDALATATPLAYTPGRK